MIWLLLPLLALASCRGKTDVPARAVVAPGGFDWSRPSSALSMGADDVAARLGSFEQRTDVRWTVSRGPGSRTISTVERHRVRQLARGEFEADSDVDPGGGPGSETGRTVVYVGGTTYARSRWTIFRERPEDRGSEARRTRDDSFRIAHDVAALCGPGLRLRETGTATVLGRPVRRFALSLEAGARAAPAAPPGRASDAQTKARVELLEGAAPLSVDGELALDAATGSPLWSRVHASFGLASDPALRADVDLDARVTAIGAAVASVQRPAGARRDERKPNGPARALEAAGLRERGKQPPGTEGEPEPPSDDQGE